MLDKIYDGIESVNGTVNAVVWGWPTIILILGVGLLLTVLTRAMQIRKLGESINATIISTIKTIGKPKKKSRTANSISQYEAFAAAISGTVGTGNIIGVTSAILTGGPGAVVWMWISAFFGMITNYAENVLGLFYRRKDDNGNFSGGAFYYIAYGLKQKWLGYIAAAFCLLAAVGMSGVQTNKISGTLTSAIGNDADWVKLVIGVTVAAITAVVIIGGIKRIGKIASLIVPFMSLLFIILALVIIFINVTAIPEVIKLIFTSAFSCKAVAGGVGGFIFSQIIKKGMARGVFSNEAGLGSSVIAHSASETREPVKQGLWGIFEVFFDTFIICSLTAFVILTTNVHSGAYADGTFFAGGDSGTALAAFSNNLGVLGTVIFSVILPLFAFTTIIAWSYFGEKACEFCFQRFTSRGKKIAVTIFKCIFVLLIIVSATVQADLLWNLDDTFNGLMALPNLIALIFLSGKVVKITQNYYARRRGEKVEPMLSAYPELNEEFKKDIEENADENY